MSQTFIALPALTSPAHYLAVSRPTCTRFIGLQPMLKLAATQIAC